MKPGRSESTTGRISHGRERPPRGPKLAARRGACFTEMSAGRSPRAHAVTVSLPSLLEPVTGGVRELVARGECLREVFADLIEREPRLRRHLFNEAGELRRHVLCFHNGTNTRWLVGPSGGKRSDSGGRRLDGWDTPVADGDTIIFMQAVSGG